MNTPTVKQFFNNKLTIRLKNGHRFQGLLSQVDYKNQTMILQDVEDLGNQTDKNFIPHDKKITEKAFECDNIEQILFKEKHFCQAKKYNKGDFWDAVSEPVAQQPKYKEKNYGQKNDKPYYKKNYYDNNRGDNNRGGDNRRRQGGNNYNNNNRDNRGGNYKNYQQKERPNNEYKKKEQKPDSNKQENDRDYR